MLVLNHLNFYLTSELELTIVGYSKLFLRNRYRKMVTFYCYMQIPILSLQRVLCDDYKKVTIHFQDETSGVAHNTTANITTLSDGRRRLVAYFSYLPENRQYQATCRVHYNQITLRSNKFHTSEMFSYFSLFSHFLFHYDTNNYATCLNLIRYI